MRTLITTLCLCILTTAAQTVEITGELKQWHTVSLTFDGPDSAEDATPNPFLDYRLNATFTNGGTSYVVPGFYAADGDAANTGATSGNQWRVRFTPDRIGTWTWTLSFKQGTRINVAIEGVDPDPADVLPWSPLDGSSGQFTIAASDKTGRDFRAHGRIRYADGHHFTFAGTGAPFVKTGMDSAENFLGYIDFDQTYKDPNAPKNKTPKGIIHRFTAHESDWQSGDPTWTQRDGASGSYGKGIIGAINYLSDRGINSHYFLTYNIDGGDGMDTWPWRAIDERLRFDVSKLAQWEVLFAHMDRQGLAQYHVLTEQENHKKLGETEAPKEGGGFGNKLNDGRRLYFRELVARFGHHNAVFWNVGEENNYSQSARIEHARYLRLQDPYDHPIGIHNPVDQVQSVAGEIIGSPYYDFIAMQDAVADYNSNAATIRSDSAAAGRPLVVWADEQNPGVDNTTEYRTIGMWQAYLGGCGGVEWYAGGDDQSLDDYRPEASNGRFRDFRALRHFFTTIVSPIDLAPDNSLVTGTNATCLADPGDTYVVHLPQGGATSIDLRSAGGSNFDVHWYDPRVGDASDGGGDLLDGSVTSVAGGVVRDLGTPPSAPTADWVVLLRAATGGGPPVISSLVADPDPVTGMTTTLQASTSDPDGDPLSHSWVVTGAPGGVPAPDLTPAGDRCAVVFHAAGSYTFRLTVTAGGQQVSDTLTLTVEQSAASIVISTE